MKRAKKSLLLAVFCGAMLNLCACGAQNNANPEDTDTLSEAETEIGTVDADVLRMREEASPDSDIIGLLKGGQQVVIVSDAGEYYYVHITLDDNPDDILEGYVRKEYVKTN
ncbi:MAG: SH3 domain-containing protein [Roseburia sp.]|nr:SH3 domain-containing protein [Roseburia sp.]